MSDQIQTEVLDGQTFKLGKEPAADISLRTSALPSWLARRLLRANEEITWVTGPSYSPSWERKVTHPALFVDAMILGGVSVAAGYLLGALPIGVFAAAGLLLGSIFVLGIANGHFTRVVVTNQRLVVMQGCEVVRAWTMEKLPQSLVRFTRRDDGQESRTVDLDALKTMLGPASDKFAEAKTIMSFAKKLDQIKLRENGHS
jgi:hypothetical protein